MGAEGESIAEPARRRRTREKRTEPGDSLRSPGAKAEGRVTDRASWLERTSTIPESPGVYLMRDADGGVAYVGKAKSLRARVRSYFQKGTDGRANVDGFLRVLADVETVVTRSEKEALLLERELIRRHAPRFNVIWRDDKQYLCLRVDPNHEFPWVQVVRQVAEDGARYFGPFHSASAARRTLRVVNRHFRLRTCRDSVLYHRSRPCLEYQIGRCPAPCVFEIDREAYREGVEDVVMFLDGHGKPLVERLRDRMWSAAERESYEAAAYYRDQILAVERTLEPQEVVFDALVERDAFGLHREGERLALSVVEVRRGRVADVVTRLFSTTTASDEEFLESFLFQRYEDHVRVPAEILTPLPLPSAQILTDVLKEQRGTHVAILCPKRGDRRSLVELAMQNAVHGFRERVRKDESLERGLDQLKRGLGLRRLPVRMECFDISNFQGSEIVGAKVSFVHGEPNRAGYRRYRIRRKASQDDFGAMYEVLLRRLRRGALNQDLPDLIVVDGGRGQLNAACAALKDAGVHEVEVVSLAKSRVLEGGGSDPSRSEERVFVVGRKDPLVFPRASAERAILTRLRDEAHRFAITFHRKRRERAALRSRLDGLPGIGPARKRALLRRFGSVRGVERAALAELAEVPGVGPRVAERLYAILHPGSSSPGMPSAGSAELTAGGAVEAASRPDLREDGLRDTPARRGECADDKQDCEPA